MVEECKPNHDPGGRFDRRHYRMLHYRPSLSMRETDPWSLQVTLAAVGTTVGFH